MMTEYEYLQVLVMWRYQTDIEEIVNPIHDRHKNALLQGDMDLAVCLEIERNTIHQKLFAERLRSEDIMRWLEFDSELREVGETYPSAMEGSIKLGGSDESY